MPLYFVSVRCLGLILHCLSYRSVSSYPSCGAVADECAPSLSADTGVAGMWTGPLNLISLSNKQLFL